MASKRRVSNLVYLALALGILILFVTKISGKNSEIKSEAAQNDRVAIALEDVIDVDPAAPFDPKVAYHNIINEKPFAPVVIFSKSYCPYSHRAKDILLNKFSISPAPRVVELDQHPNGQELQQYIGQLTGRRTVPNVVILKTSVGGGDDMAALVESGAFVSKFEEWGNGLLRVTPK